MRRSSSRRTANGLTDAPAAESGRERIRPDPPAPLPVEPSYDELHAGHWGEPFDETLADGSRVARRRWVFTHPDRSSNQKPLPAVEQIALAQVEPSEPILCEECGRFPAHFLATAEVDPLSQAQINAIDSALGFAPSAEYLRAEREILARNLCRECHATLSRAAQAAAKPAEPVNPSPGITNVVSFPGSKPKRGRKAREAFGPDSIYVDPVRSSKNKCTVRVRWIEPDGSRPILTARQMAAVEFNQLKRSKKAYEVFTNQLIAVCRSRAIRQGDGIGGRADRVL